MQNPVTEMKRKFYYQKGSFTELKDKVLSLNPSVDVIIANNEIYFLTLAGENLFNMERSYKATKIISKNILIAQVGSEIILYPLNNDYKMDYTIKSES